MRNATLHALLAAFTGDAARRLDEEAQRGAEIPFELVAEPGTRPPLYVFRPLTSHFIETHLAKVCALESFSPAVRALAAADGLPDYLRLRGRTRVPPDLRDCAREGLRAFLEAVFAEHSRVRFEPERFEAAYAQLELALYAGRRTTTVLAPVAGVALADPTHELALGHGLHLIRGDRLAAAPAEAAFSAERQPRVLATVTVTGDGAGEDPLAAAGARLLTLLSALRLLRRGTFSLGPLAWTGTDGGAWRPLALGAGGRARSITFLSSGDGDELRHLLGLVVRHRGQPDEVGWALARFEMGCDRADTSQALTDYLLALRALLEPEGPASGRLPGRVAALCADPSLRGALTERMVRALALERALVAGTRAAGGDAQGLVTDVAEHLRVVLGDALRGRGADELCAEADDRLLRDAIVPS